MKIDILQNSGFCGGVIGALSLLDRTIKSNPDRVVYLLGQIVHNSQVNKKYQDLGVKCISLLDTKRLNDGDIVVISAHGISNTDREQLKRFTIIDTTCPFVMRNKIQIDKNDQNNVIFIGEKNHRETIGMTKDNKKIKIVETPEDLNGYHSDSFGEVFNQTTFNIDSLKQIHELIKEKCPFFNINDTICHASKTLQESLKEKTDYTICIIVGDKKSHNAKSLYEMSPYSSTYFIQSQNDVKDIRLRSYDKILIVGSASTPKNELQLVKNALKNKQFTE